MLSHVNNTETNSTDHGRDVHGLSAQNATFISLYSVIVTVGIIGNSLVVFVIRTRRSLHTTTNFLLGNLALTDVLILVWVLHTELLSYTYNYPSGITGDYLCKVLTGGFLVNFLIRVGLLTLTALAYERYNALVNAMNSNIKLTKENFFKAVSMMWIVSLLVGIPETAVSKYDQTAGYCIGVWTYHYTNRIHIGYRVYATILLAFFGIVPALIISFSYYKIVKGLAWDMTICGQDIAGQNDIKAKRRVVRLLVTVTVMFYISYAPFTATVLLSAWQKHAFAESALVKANITSSFLVFCSCCFNPFLYSCQSTSYRQEMKNLFAKTFKFPYRNCNTCSVRMKTDVSAKYNLRDDSREMTSIQIGAGRYNQRTFSNFQTPI